MRNCNHLHNLYNQDNIRPKLNPKEKDSGEGSISATECLDALKVMGERKSHGMDGFTVEFYKFFWKDLSQYLVWSINFSYVGLHGEMSATQKSVLITTLPKSNKESFSFQILDTKLFTTTRFDYKIPLAATTNVVKKVLPTIISHAQMAKTLGFLKNNSMTYNTRLIYNITDK